VRRERELAHPAAQSTRRHPTDAREPRGCAALARTGRGGRRVTAAAASQVLSPSSSRCRTWSPSP
jgi:hypothetical protein